MTQEIENAVKVLQTGGILLYPTDTIWGIGCDALMEGAVQKVYQLKNRSDHKSLIILLAEPKAIFNYVAAPPPDIIDLLQSFDRPTTVIYGGALGLPDNLIGEDGSIGIRITRDSFCKRLIKKLGHPIVSTSANTSGRPSPKSFMDIEPVIKNGVDYIVNYRREEDSEKIPSKIIRIFSDGRQDVIRG